MRFVTLVKFTPSGVTNIKGSTQRAKEFIGKAEASGIQIHELLWTQGQYDGLILFEAADVETAAAAMLNAAANGNVSTETMAAFDADSMDKILAKNS